MSSEPERTAGSPLSTAAPQISIVFMGTPAFAATALEMLCVSGFRVVGVVTRPDKKVGRKQELIASPVKELALRSAIPAIQPEKLDDTAYATVAGWKPDIIIVAAYGRILTERFLSLPGFGCINIHASLLPRWRGASPVQNALMRGDQVTGVTLMQMDAGLDTGPIIAQRSTPIGPDERADALLARLAQLGADLLRETLPLWMKRKITAVPQNETEATLCQLIEREDGRIFWTESAEDIYNRFRGLSPWPGVFAFWKRGEDDTVRVKLTDITCQRITPLAPAPCGTVIEVGEDIGVRAGAGVIFLREVQLEGKERLPIRDFLNGNPSFLGSVLL
jgi:methionyl-tRNA formyltransferase